MKPVLPPYSSVPYVGSPYPYPFGHTCRRQSYGGSSNSTVNHSQMDPIIVHELTIVCRSLLESLTSADIPAEFVGNSKPLGYPGICSSSLTSSLPVCPSSSVPHLHSILSGALPYFLSCILTISFRFQLCQPYRWHIPLCVLGHSCMQLST